MRVLVVDDEPRFRVYLSAQLASLGHEVAVAGSGGEAIERGLAFRPNLLVSDWMLCNHVHGLHVVDALRAVDSSLPAILMTGFPSRDLRAQARQSRVLEFLEKPFEVVEFVTALRRAQATRRRVRPRVAFGVIATHGELCTWASERARVMLAPTRAGRSPDRVGSVFDEAALEALAGGEEWALVAPRAKGRVLWWAHWTIRGADGVIGILPRRKPFLRYDPRLRMLLSLPPPNAAGNASGSRVVVVDARPLAEVHYPQQLEALGWSCLKAESAGLALRIVEADPGLGLVVVDRSVPDLDLPGFVAELRRLRPCAEIVGTSELLSDERTFAAVGVGRFLHSPWRVGDLLHELAV